MPASTQGNAFCRVVTQQGNRACVQCLENVSGDIVGACIGRKAQLLIGIHRIQAFILQGIGANLVAQSNATTFLTKVDDGPVGLLADQLHGRLQLRAAIAAQ